VPWPRPSKLVAEMTKRQTTEEIHARGLQEMLALTMTSPPRSPRSRTTSPPRKDIAGYAKNIGTTKSSSTTAPRRREGQVEAADTWPTSSPASRRKTWRTCFRIAKDGSARNSSGCARCARTQGEARISKEMPAPTTKAQEASSSTTPARALASSEFDALSAWRKGRARTRENGGERTLAE